MEISRHDRDVLVAEIVNALSADGAAIVEGRFHGDVLESLRHDLDPWTWGLPAGSQTGDQDEQRFHGRRTTRFGGIASKSPMFVEVLCDPLLVGVAEAFLLPSCGSIQCAGSQVIAVGSGEPAQDLHCDQSAWEWFNDLSGSPEVAISAMVALTDFTEANGATRVVPGSNRLVFGSPDAYDAQAAVPASMPAGSVLLYTGKTVHGAGANHYETTRVGLHIFYALGWLRPEEAHQLALDESVARELPEQARQLLGFTQYTPKGGGGRLWTVDYEDPGARYR